MKLIAASTLALAATYSAQTIESLIGQLINEVYQHDPDANTYTFNVAPYFNAVYTCTGNGFTSEGTIGNGNGVFDFSEKVEWTQTSAQYDWEASGKTKSHPALSLFAFPEYLWEDSMSQKGSLKVDTEGIAWELNGEINGDEFGESISLSLDEMAVTRSKYEAEISFSRKSTVSSNIDEFYQQFLIPAGQTNVELDLSAKKVCAENPLHKDCTGKITVSGDNDGMDFGENVAKYSVYKSKAQFEIKHNGNQVFWMALLGIDSFEVLSLKYKVNGGKAVLAVQFVGPNGFGPLIDAAEKFGAPFASFFGNIATIEDTVHIVAYFDKVAATFDNEMFNVYPIIAATKFESDLLKDVLGVSFQKWAEAMSNSAADLIVGAAQDGGEMVGSARQYVNDVTGPVGETKFDAWFAQLA